MYTDHASGWREAYSDPAVFRGGEIDLQTEIISTHVNPCEIYTCLVCNAAIRDSASQQVVIWICRLHAGGEGREKERERECDRKLSISFQVVAASYGYSSDCIYYHCKEYH